MSKRVANIKSGDPGAAMVSTLSHQVQHYAVLPEDDAEAPVLVVAPECLLKSRIPFGV